MLPSATLKLHRALFAAQKMPETARPRPEPQSDRRKFGRPPRAMRGSEAAKPRVTRYSAKASTAALEMKGRLKSILGFVEGYVSPVKLSHSITTFRIISSCIF
jgi:hypothetical protein